MSALAVYQSMSGPDRAAVRKRILQLAKLPAKGALVDVLGIDSRMRDATLSDDANAIVTAAVREWWQTAGTAAIAAIIDANGETRVRELAAVLCAESVSRLTDDPRVEECRRVRLAWVRGGATDEQWDAAGDAASDAAWVGALSTAKAATWAAVSTEARDATEYAALAAAWDATRVTAWDAAWGTAWAAARATLASPLRTLFPDPTRLDWRDALTRWDVAVAEARAAIKEFSILNERKQV